MESTSLEPKTNGLSTASWILGVITFVSLIIPVLPILTGLVALALGIVALVQISRSGGVQKGKAGAIIGIVLGVLGLSSSIIVITILALLGPAIEGIFQNITNNL